MSILSQELLRKTSADSHESHERSSDAKIPKDNFRELLQAQPTNEKSLVKDFFNLFMEDEEESDSKGNESMIAAVAPPPCPFEVPCTASFSVLGTGALSLAASPPGIEALFEKMASCMIVMSTSHEIETTLFLDNPHFASSSLFGTQITIREFSTAPKAFNIEISSNSLAVALINSSKNDLLSAFQNGNFNFTVHRFDAHIQQNDDRPVLHRKEESDREQKDQRGDRGQ
jgi:hypothetical protein